MQYARNLALTIALIATFVFGVIAANPSAASAQNQRSTEANVGQLIRGLVNVNVGAIVVGDIIITDVVDVNDVLNDNNVEILNNVLNNSPILSNNSNILTDFLNNNDIIDDTVVVVGVLTGGIVVVQDIPTV